MKILIIDDDTLVTEALNLALSDQWDITIINSINEIPKDISEFSAALVDMHLTNNPKSAEGVDVLKKLRKKNPQIELVAMSGNLDRQLMEDCLKAGASRFLAKPLSNEELTLTLEKIEAYKLLQSATHRSHSTRINWIGESQPSQNVKRQIAEFKGESGPLLIEGESGTGKEVVVQLIHNQSHDRPLISFNVAAIPETLFESELFGHVKGAFTGADSNKMGLAEAAHGGDLFLDEIEALSINSQVKLLRFLETGEVRRVGSKSTTTVKTRVIVATNKPLEELVESGDFREDLLWRLSGKKMILPPLRERTSDIKSLCHYFFSKDSIRNKTLSDDALESLQSYSWPGNVRELRRVCEQLLFTSPLPIVRKEDVDQVLFKNSNQSINLDATIDLKKGLTTLLQEFERSILLKSSQQFSNLDDLTKVLKISRSNLYKKLKDYNINWKN